MATRPKELQELYDAILSGDATAAPKAALAAISIPMKGQRVLDEALLPAMAEAGRLFEEGEYYVPELLVSARAMKATLSALKEVLAQEAASDVGTAKAPGTVVIGTAKGDIHDIGKNLVAAMLEGAGVTVVDLGVDVSPEDFAKTARDRHAGVVAVSALLTTTMGGMKDVVDALRKQGVEAKVVVGGAPVTDEFAKSIGASGYAPDASSAARLIKSLL